MKHNNVHKKKFLTSARPMRVQILITIWMDARNFEGIVSYLWLHWHGLVLDMIWHGCCVPGWEISSASYKSLLQIALSVVLALVLLELCTVLFTSCTVFSVWIHFFWFGEIEKTEALVDFTCCTVLLGNLCKRFLSFVNMIWFVTVVFRTECSCISGVKNAEVVLRTFELESGFLI